MKKAMYVKMTEKEFIIYRKNEEGKEERIECIEIRGAIVAPTISHPGYYLLFGKKMEVNENGEHLLVFLAEGEGVLQRDLFGKLVDDVTKFYCHTIYTEYSIKKQSEFSIDLRKILKNLKLKVNLYPSLPYTLDEDIKDGIVRIREWQRNELLDIPKESILGKQLGEVEPENLDESFYSVNALRFLITWFGRDESTRLVDEFRDRVKKAEKKDKRDKLDSLSKIAWEEHDKIKEQKELEDEYEREGGFW